MTKAEEAVGQYTLRWGPMVLVAVGSALIATLGVRIVGPRQEQDEQRRHYAELAAKFDVMIAQQKRSDSLALIRGADFAAVVAGTVFVACQVHPREAYLAGLPCLNGNNGGTRLVPRLPPYTEDRGFR